MNRNAPFISKATKLFKAERDAILSGDSSDLDKISDQKESFIREILDHPSASQETYLIVAKEAKINANFISAYLSGVKGAIFDIRTIRAAASGTEAYDCNGTRINAENQRITSDRRV